MLQELQTQWEVALPLLYDTVILELLPSYYPSLHLEVVCEEKEEPSSQHNGYSLEKEIAPTKVVHLLHLAQNV